MAPETSAIDYPVSEQVQTDRSHWRVILLLALALRLVVALFSFDFSAVPPLTHWGFENIAIALSLHAGRGFSSPFFSDSGPTAFMAPGYPLFLSAVMALFGTGSLAATAIVALQEVFSLLTVVIVMDTARLHFGQRTANLAGLICAVAPPMLIAPVKIWDTSLSALMLSGIFWAASSGHLSRGKFIGAGVACALVGLVNPALIPSVWCISAWAAWKCRTFPWAGILTFFVVFSPWPLRNAAVMHSFIPLRTDFGYELWIGNHPGADGNFVESMNPMMSATERRAFVQKGEIAYLHEKGTLAKAWIASNPGHFGALTTKRFVQFWTGSEAGTDATTVPILVMAVAGLGLLWRRKSIAVLYALPILVFPLPYYITHVYVRFQYVIDPLLVLLAAHAVGAFLSYLRPSNGTELT
jgi:Dolichyl-phosphate-mannose-protein mannosyltransferase